jgi:TonB family protein
LLASFVLLSVWPFLSALLPEIGVPVSHADAANATVTVEQFVVGKRAAPIPLQVSPILLWSIACFIAVAPLLIAHVRLYALVRRAVRCEDPAWNALLRELCFRLQITKLPRLLVHPGPIMPMASGVLRTKIVLPSDCVTWTASRRQMVLLHELAHIARRDLLWQRSVRVVSAVWWFQPLSWLGLILLRRESEKACDERVIGAGIRPSEYAAELLSIAKLFTANDTALSMARADGLETRLQSILRPETKTSGWLLVGPFICLTALTLVASAVTLSPTQSLSPRGHTMKRTVFTGLLVSAGLTAATIGGSLYDPSGAAVSNAKALLFDPDSNTKLETTTAADGKFAFEALPAGQYILRVQSPGFATLFREFNVKADSRVDRGLTLALGKIQETVNVAAEGTPAAAAPTESKRIRVGGAVEQTNLITKVQPIYPATAKAAGVQGPVNLEMVISKEGEPLDIRVLSSPSDDLTQSALEAVRQWKYKPTLLNGNPVEIVTDVLVNYTLLK